MTVESTDEELRHSGYQPELKRTLGGFQVFAISFAFISVLVAIFATYGAVLNTSGPVGIWLWILAAVGQTLVALVVAQFAARIALSGSSYQWASRLANPKVGWLFGWLTFWFLAIAVAAMDNATGKPSPHAPVRDGARRGCRPVDHVGAVTDSGGARHRLHPATRHGHVRGGGPRAGDPGGVGGRPRCLSWCSPVPEPSTTWCRAGVAADASNYFAIGGPLMGGMIMGLVTLVGFDSAANLAEEAKDPFRTVPRAIVSSVVASAVLGLLFVIILTLAIKDITRVTTSGSPVATIIRDQLGPVMERVLLTGIVFAMFGAAMVMIAACSRQAFAMARDSRFPGHTLFRRVSPRTQTPVPATILILVIGVVLMVALPGEALLQLIIASTILPALIYGGIVVLYLCVRKRLETKEGGFSLGRFELPVAYAALIWVAFSIFALVSPSDARIPGLIVLGLILVGGLYFATMLRVQPRSLGK